MKNCFQSKNQSIYERGEAVQKQTLYIINLLNNNLIDSNYRIPDYFYHNRELILANLIPIDDIKDYTLFHDCGKPYCQRIDERGVHFDNHAEVSKDVWMSISDNEQVAKLISMDMIIHKMKACDIDSFIQHKECVTLLLVGLAEIHANAEMFGGIESESFKIKYSQINRRGKAILQKLEKIND
jgi:hypothetical protein